MPAKNPENFFQKIGSALDRIPAPIWQIGLVFYAVLIWIGSNFPDPGLAASCAVWPSATAYLARKSLHLLEFAGLGGLFFGNFRPRTARGFFMIFAVVILWAALDEFHQSFTPGRGPHAADVGWDALGAAVGLVIAAKIFPQKKS